MPCMRCGRETANEELFCPECRKHKEVLRTNAETSERRSILWVEQKLHAGRAAAEERTEQKPNTERLLRIGFIAVCALLIAVTAASTLEHFRYDKLKRQQKDFQVREASIRLREEEANRLDERISELEQNLADAQAELENQKKNTAKLEKAARELSALEKDNARLIEQLDFWKQSVVFYSVGNDWYFHRYGCEKLDLEKPFQVYTPDAAKNTAHLLPCPDCGLSH